MLEKKSKHILIIEDEKLIAYDIEKKLNRSNFTTTIAYKYEQIFKEIETNISYIYPINRVIVQNFTLDVEGYFKSINDKINSSNNYTINGLIAKGVLNF